MAHCAGKVMKMTKGGFKKLMWYEIMKEFNWKVTSTSSCDGEREMASTLRQCGKRMDKEGRRSWIASSGPSGHCITSSCGKHGTIIFCTLRYKKMTSKKKKKKEKVGRVEATE